MTKVLVIGAGGMLGQDLMSQLRDLEVVGLTRADLDICVGADVIEAVRGFDVVINSAAYTKVDDAESHPEVAFAVNALGARNIAQATASSEAHLIHVSTDYVFDGGAQSPYEEDAPANPSTVYGRTKAEGEEAVREINDLSTIVRTSWLYGEHGPNFPKTIAKLGHRQDSLDVVDDQTGQPTSTLDVARLIKSLIVSGNPTGIFHATNSGSTTWWNFARVLFAKAGWDPDRVRPVSSSAFARPAPRPAWSVLGHERWASAGIEPPRPWEQALDEAWEEYLRDFFRMSIR